MTTTIIDAENVAEFLALVPRLAGCRPVRSVALVPFAGSRTLGVLRVDLPPDDTDRDRVAATVVGMVCKIREADGVAVVVYTDRPFADEDGIVHGDFVRSLCDKADACGLRVSDAFCVAEDGWGSYLADGGRRSLAEIDDAALVDRLPDDLRAPLGDQSTGAGLPEAGPRAAELVASALQTLGEAVVAVCSATGEAEAAHADLAALDPQALAAACVLDDVPAFFEDVLEWDAACLRPFDAAALIWCLGRPALRDIALVQWCGDRALGDAAAAAQLRWEAGDDYPEAIARRLRGDAPRPDATRLARALDVVRHTAALAPRAERAGALSAAGWLCWALGRGTHAGWFAEQAASIDPAHGLAGILRGMLAAGRLPEWAFERPLATAV